MSTQYQEAIFEAPAGHETSWESSPEGYASPEAGFEGETHETSHYASPEGYASPESWEGEGEGEADPFLGNILGSLFGSGEGEWGYASPESWEGEGEADQFFGKILGMLGKAAKGIAPGVARAVGGLFPGGSPLAKLVGSFLREGEQEAGAMEAQLFGPSAAETEIGDSQAAQAAALTELLAHEAAESSTESEAQAVLAGSLPITITIMRSRRLLRPVVPALTQANGRLVRTLRRRGRPGRQLLRTVPTVQRRTIGALRAAARAGQPITGPLAAQTMARAARSVLGDPRKVRRAVVRNAVLRQRVAPPHPRRARVFAPQRVSPYNPRRRPAGAQAARWRIPV